MNNKDFSEYDNAGYNDFMLNRQHPNCRCSIIAEPEKIYFTYVEGCLVDEYLEECDKQGLWIN